MHASIRPVALAIPCIVLSKGITTVQSRILIRVNKAVAGRLGALLRALMGQLMEAIAPLPNRPAVII